MIRTSWRHVKILNTRKIHNPDLHTMAEQIAMHERAELDRDGLIFGPKITGDVPDWLARKLDYCEAFTGYRAVGAYGGRSFDYVPGYRAVWRYSVAPEVECDCNDTEYQPDLCPLCGSDHDARSEGTVYSYIGEGVYGTAYVQRRVARKIRVLEGCPLRRCYNREGEKSVYRVKVRAR